MAAKKTTPPKSRVPLAKPEAGKPRKAVAKAPETRRKGAATSSRSPESADSRDEDGPEEEADSSDDEFLLEPSDREEEDQDAEIVTTGETREDGDDEGFDEEAVEHDETIDAGELPDEEYGARSQALVPSRKSPAVGRLDPLEAYMREIQAHRLLTPEEEKQLAVRYHETEDVQAAARLVTANLRLVVKLAYEYRRAYRNMMDLIQEGNMGLMQAVKKYDPYRGVKLSSYAAWWIRAYMLRFILNNWRMVKLGTTQAQRKLFFNLNKERARLSALGIEPSNAEIAARLDVTESEVEEMDKRLSRGDASLDTPVSEADGRQTARVELMPTADGSPDSINEGAELSFLVRQNLDEFRSTLSGKDLVIFDQRLVADEPRTLQDLGDEFGVSRERVRQLEARLTGKLRAFLSERLGDAVEVA